MPSANPTPHPLDAAARDELARKAEAASPGPWRVVARDGELWVHAENQRWRFVAVAGAEDLPSSRANSAFIAACSPDVILALLASVRGAEADTAKAEEALDDEQNAHLETQRALVLLANQLETHSVPFVPAAELATYKARRDVAEFDKLLARGMEAARQAYDAAKAKRAAARAHPPTEEPANA